MIGRKSERLSRDSKNGQRIDPKKLYDRAVNGEFYICGSGGAPTKAGSNVPS